MQNAECKMQNNGIRSADFFNTPNGRTKILHYAFCILH